MFGEIKPYLYNMIKCSTKEGTQRDMYWPKEKMNQVILEYNATTDQDKRSEIFETELYDRLFKIAQIWLFKVTGYNTDNDAINDGIVFAASILPKFNPEFGDSFGWISFCVKRFYQQRNINLGKQSDRFVALETFALGGEDESGSEYYEKNFEQPEETFRSEEKLQLLTDFLEDNRSYELINKKYDGTVAEKRRLIKRLKTLHLSLKAQDDSVITMKGTMYVVSEVSKIFSYWLENRPKSPALPVVIDRKMLPKVFPCRSCGSEVTKTHYYNGSGESIICPKCREIRRDTKSSLRFNVPCIVCGTQLKRASTVCDKAICKPCSNLRKSNKAKARRQLLKEEKIKSTSYVRINEKLSESKTIFVTECKSTVSAEAALTLMESVERTVEFFHGDALQTMVARLSEPTVTESTDKLIKFFKGEANLPVENGTFIAYSVNITETIVTPEEVGLTKSKPQTIISRKAVLKRQPDRHTLKCDKCGKERTVSYVRYRNSVNRGFNVCNACSKAVAVRRLHSKHPLKCSKCGNERLVTYNMYMSRVNKHNLCGSCASKRENRPYPKRAEQVEVSCTKCGTKKLFYKSSIYAVVPWRCRNCHYDDLAKKKKTYDEIHKVKVNCSVCGEEKSVEKSNLYAVQRLNKQYRCKKCFVESMKTKSNDENNKLNTVLSKVV